jgi:hypothetical protein
MDKYLIFKFSDNVIFDFNVNWHIYLLCTHRSYIAMKIIEQNQEFINWKFLSNNPLAIDLLIFNFVFKKQDLI